MNKGQQMLQVVPPTPVLNSQILGPLAQPFRLAEASVRVATTGCHAIIRAGAREGVASQLLLFRCAHRNNMATARAAAVEHAPTTPRLHPRPEAMHPATPLVVRLIGPLHGITPAKMTAFDSSDPIACQAHHSPSLLGLSGPFTDDEKTPLPGGVDAFDPAEARRSPHCRRAHFFCQRFAPDVFRSDFCPCYCSPRFATCLLSRATDALAFPLVRRGRSGIVETPYLAPCCSVSRPSTLWIKSRPTH